MQNVEMFAKQIAAIVLSQVSRVRKEIEYEKV
jgi:hypothetical protein